MPKVPKFPIHLLDKLKPAFDFTLYVLKPDLPPLCGSRKASTNAAPAPKSQVAYLDGLRGFASLIVYFTHHTMYSHKGTWAIHRAFGWQGQYYFATFPGVRLLFSGGAFSVAVFFVISGYVLSISPLTLLHRGNVEKLASSLGTALPRRFVSLYFPVLCTTLLIATSWHLFGIRSSNGATPPPRQTYARELSTWIFNFFHMTFVYGNRVMDFDQYNPHLWNIPAQFRGMVVVNAMLGSMLAFNQWGVNARLWAMLACIVYFLVPIDGWYCAQFIVGMLVCELDILSEKDQLPPVFNRLKPLTLRGLLWPLLFLISIWIAGVPRVHNPTRVSEQDPGWQYTDRLVPPATENAVWYWEFWAATLALVSIPRVHVVRRFFECSFCLWLGKMSFGLYLVHGPVLYTIGDRLYAAVGRANDVSRRTVPEWVDVFPLPGWGPLGLEVNTLAVQVVLVPLTFWLAGVAHKLFDEPGPKLAYWLFDPKRCENKVSEERQGLVQGGVQMQQV